MTQPTSQPSMVPTAPEATKTIFVIMPFRETQTRNTQELTSFFDDQIRRPIEQNSTSSFRYRVHRSDNDFNITSQIILDLFYADIVICDLSGNQPNPNVMYELGVRLSISNRPVILIRERTSASEPFDIVGFHVHDYNPLDYSSLAAYIREKIGCFESGEEEFRSPVLDVLEVQVPIIRTGRDRAANLVNLLEVGLFLNLQLTARTLNDYLTGKVDRRFTIPAFSLPQELKSALEELQQLDWSEFRMILAPHPSMTHYLSSPYLVGLVEDEVERRFSVEVMSYHAKYFVEATGWLRVDPSRLLLFAQDTLYTMMLCRRMANALRATNEEEYQHWLDGIDDLIRPQTIAEPLVEAESSSENQGE